MNDRGEVPTARCQRPAAVRPCSDWAASKGTFKTDREVGYATSVQVQRRNLSGLGRGELSRTEKFLSFFL